MFQNESSSEEDIPNANALTEMVLGWRRTAAPSEQAADHECLEMSAPQHKSASQQSKGGGGGGDCVTQTRGSGLKMPAAPETIHTDKQTNTGCVLCEPEVFFSSSVISSSSCGAAQQPTPSCQTTHGVEQGLSAMFARHLGSSRSNSPKRTPSQATTTTTISITSTLTSTAQAIEVPKKQVQIIDLTQSSRFATHSVEDYRGLVPPNSGQSGDANTTGALSDQDSNIDVTNFQNDSNDIVDYIWDHIKVNNDNATLERAKNIPEESAIIATVQGNVEINPPPSFNNNYNNSNRKMNYSNNIDNYIENQLKDYASRAVKCEPTDSNERALFTNAGWGIPRGLGLYGGGESSLNNGTSNWGTPGPAGTNTNQSSGSSGWGNTGGQPPPNQWGNNTNTNNSSSSNNNNRGTGGAPNAPSQPTAQQNAGLEAASSLLDLSAASAPGGGAAKSPPATVAGSPAPSSTWAQAAGKGLAPVPAPPAVPGAAPVSTVSTKQQLEQLNTMREALFSQDGWGGQHVNQDSTWDVPSSPEPSLGKDGVPVWKPNINNGTDLWEANLRNGGQPPPAAAAKTPWGHTPTSNIGGTWGEDDDAGDSSNVWTGVPANQPGPQWSQGPQPGMWGGPKKDNDWSSGGASNWGDCRDPRGDPRGPMDPRGDPRGPMDPRDMRGGDPRDMRGMDPHMRGPGGDGMMRGDPRGISGRLNGDNAMWGGPAQNQPPHHHNPHQVPGKMGPAQGVGQWPGPPPKEMGGGGGKPSGWEEPSPPPQRRGMANYDDGTSLWGPAQQQRGGGGGNMPPGSKVSHWKEMPTPRGGPGAMNCPPGMPQNRPLGNPAMKPDGNPLWVHPPRNGSWDGPHDGPPGNWEDKGPVMGGNQWGGEPPMPQNNWGAPKQKPGGQWDDMDPSTWGHPKQGPKPLTKELVWASKQFRILSDLGYKKEDVESALRSTNMNLEDAIELLRINVEPWRRHEPHEHPFDHSAFPGQRFNPPQPMAFAPPGPGNNAALLGNPNNGPAGSLANISNMSPAVVQKMLTNQPPPQQPGPGGSANQTAPFGSQPGRQPASQPSTQQLRMLVQQIQMAVQAGYLNHQILNQPLAPQTLLLLNQLLQQIKVLQQFMQQQTSVVHQPGLKGNSQAVLHISVQITKTKQQIQNLQNQIASQQAIYVKQQQQPGQEFFKHPDPLAALQNNLADLNMGNKEAQAATYQSQQSRLNQWKLPSLDKEGEGNEFSRAPGTTAKPALPQSHSSPNMNPLLSQGDGPWASVTRSNSDGWPDAVDGGGQDAKDAWPSSSQPSSAFTDLVPEFEPGKPWKGTQLKSVEDDPSMTPGSVVRSPLSLASIKDSELFGGGLGGTKSPPSTVETTIPPLSLSSNTWSFNPTTSSSFTSPLGKKSGSAWGDAPHPPTTTTSELWGAPNPMGKSRGPPPGLNKSNSAANGWGNLPSSRSASWGIQGGSGSGWGGSPWLILRNLTPQIDGSTLKTLCVQHGPLQNFHLYLNHGIALAKYNSREEANKAQGALNNCVLVNTTIFAESPGDSEVHTLLQHLGHPQQPQQQQQQQQQQASSGGGGNWGRTPAQGAPNKVSSAPADAWASSSSALWPSGSSGSSLWGSGGLESGGDQHRATPSSLNSFLPGDLLGGESM